MMTPIAGGPVKKYYYHANNLYNVSAITDKNGVVVERYNYSPYGEATILDVAGTTVLGASTIANPWTFTGRRLDAETGLMYYRARCYDVDLGRFVGRDPLEYVDGLNLYGYVKNNPANNVDPAGLYIIAAGSQEFLWTIDECGEFAERLASTWGYPTPTPNGWACGQCVLQVERIRLGPVVEEASEPDWVMTGQATNPETGNISVLWEYRVGRWRQTCYFKLNASCSRNPDSGTWLPEDVPGYEEMHEEKREYITTRYTWDWQ
jgi:RHS repeat-associated protein